MKPLTARCHPDNPEGRCRISRLSGKEGLPSRAALQGGLRLHAPPVFSPTPRPQDTQEGPGQAQAALPSDWVPEGKQA